ncbi:hypothetical protein [Lapillicoccus sp.]|uniref:hypothetical protein n=1 Tax=Lapillicoccus sp. TaxID=1909287 RepID=UPI0025F33A54|nr:hypothetical protein [Lapillicoccus sp.]
MSQFLVLSRRRTESYVDADFDALIPAETQRVRELYAAGVVRQIWLRGDVPGAAFLVEADTEQEARGAVDALPMATSGLSEFTVLPLSPYRGSGP